MMLFGTENGSMMTRQTTLFAFGCANSRDPDWKVEYVQQLIYNGAKIYTFPLKQFAVAPLPQMTMTYM